MTDWSFMSDYATGVVVAGTTIGVKVLLSSLKVRRAYGWAAVSYYIETALHITLRYLDVSAARVWLASCLVFMLVVGLVHLRAYAQSND